MSKTSVLYKMYKLCKIHIIYNVHYTLTINCARKASIIIFCDDWFGYLFKFILWGLDWVNSEHQGIWCLSVLQRCSVCDTGELCHTGMMLKFGILMKNNNNTHSKYTHVLSLSVGVRQGIIIYIIRYYNLQYCCFWVYRYTVYKN